MMRRTTILADESLFTELKYLAAREGKTVTAVVQEALVAYVAEHRAPRRLAIAGIGHSGRADVAERADEILTAEIQQESGWSPRRASSDDAPSRV
jgi:hypothetical protein